MGYNKVRARMVNFGSGEIILKHGAGLKNDCESSFIKIEPLPCQQKSI